MRTSVLAILIAFGTTVAVPAIAAEKVERPAAARDQSIQHQQMQKDAGKDATTGSTAGTMKAAPSETHGQHQPMQKDIDKK